MKSSLIRPGLYALVALVVLSALVYASYWKREPTPSGAVAPGASLLPHGSGDGGPVPAPRHRFRQPHELPDESPPGSGK